MNENLLLPQNCNIDQLIYYVDKCVDKRVQII
jgi:hypothetical protein